MMSRKYFPEKRVRVLGLLFVLIVSLAASAAQAAVQVSAKVSAPEFSVDRAVMFTITATGVRSFQPQIPEVDGLVFHKRGQSSSMEYINGSYSTSVSAMYIVEAMREGDFVIPAIPVVTTDGTVMTAPVAVKVTGSKTAATLSPRQSAGTASGTARLRSGDAARVAFMRVIPAREKSYSGEIVPVQIKVYFRDGIKANLNSLPQLQGDGFVLQQLEREPAQSRELVNNIPYTVLTWDSALSGVKEGVHKISLEIEATLLLRQQRRQPLHPFMDDSFFDSFFGAYQEKDVKIASPILDMTVLSLPDKGKPEKFSGAIGSFTLDVSARPLEIAPGDPVTLVMTVSGKGNFDRVRAPQLSDSTGWKTYTPSSEFLKDGSAGSGKKVFEQALVAKDPGLQAIPSVNFSYFDPQAGSYKTLSSAPIPLHITGKVALSAQSAPAMTSGQRQKAAGSGEVEKKESAAVSSPPLATLAPLKSEAGGRTQGLVPLYERTWFQIVVVLVLIALLAAVIFKLRAARFAANPVLQRRQAMKHLLALRFAEIDKGLAERDVRAFLLASRRAIQEQYGLLWGTESGAITYADLERTIPDDSVLLTVFKAADESAYGGRMMSSEKVKSLADAVKKELEGLS